MWIVLLILLPLVASQLTTECMYFRVSPILRYEIRDYKPEKHKYVMLEKLRRLAKVQGLPEITVRKCIIEKYGVYI